MATDGDPWTTALDFQQVGAMELEDLDLLAELTHPMRGRILRNLDSPRSAAELAELLDAPITRLYHHINRLEQSGLIAVQATRRVGAATQHRYQVVARSFTMASNLYEELDGAELAQAFGSIFDVAKIRMQHVLEHRPRDERPTEDEALLSLGELHISARVGAELINRLREVIDEFTEKSNRSDGNPPFTLFVAAFPERHNPELQPPHSQDDETDDR
jgi:DNA-binding transcriptional ArsR family regulator